MSNTRTTDPTWMLVLRAVALVLSIVLMLSLIIGVIGLYQRTQEVGDLFEGSSTTEEPAETFAPEPGPGQTEESLDWYETNEDGTESYCYTVPDVGETICEPTGE